MSRGVLVKDSLHVTWTDLRFVTCLESLVVIQQIKPGLKSSTRCDSFLKRDVTQGLLTGLPSGVENKGMLVEERCEEVFLGLR